ncbi:microtubule-actin cross-linking factor 1-like [Diadema antillarum]|uniref:microtubule-actin cross-linking factor 1-like n=1 Tax=Diadema antillarum TaxID=105358 RepID=UPI003A8A92CB
MPFVIEDFFVLYVLPLIILCIILIFSHYVIKYRSSTSPPSDASPAKPLFYFFPGYSPERVTTSPPPDVHRAPYSPQPPSPHDCVPPPEPDGRERPASSPAHDAPLCCTLPDQSEERWLRLQEKAKQRTHELESAINSLSDFEGAYNRLKTWLGEKERMTSVLGPIGVEPGILRNQKLQVEVLQEEFAAHEPQLEHLLEAAQAIAEKQDPHARDTSPVQRQADELKNTWDTLKGRLDDREGQIDDVLRESERFHDTLQDSSDWLLDFRNKISNLAPISNSPDVVRQQMEETKNLQREAERRKPQQDTLTECHRQLTSLNPELTAKAEVTLKLESVQTPLNDLCRKLDERQGKLQAALLQSRDFEESFGTMQRWLDGKDKELGQSKPISAKPEILRRQVVEHEEIPKEIVKQVYTYERMLEKIDALKEEADGPSEKSALQAKRDQLQSKWNSVNDRATQRGERLKDASDKAKTYTDELNQFLPWLRSAEDRLSSLGPVTAKPAVVRRQYELIKQLQEDIDNHRDHHEAVNNTADQLISRTDVDHPFIQDQVVEANKRWDNLQTEVQEQMGVLEDFHGRLSDFHDTVNTSQVTLANFEELLASHNAPGQMDPKNLDKLKALQDEVDGLEETIVQVQDNSSGLMAAAPSRADTTMVNDDVDNVVKRYQKLKGLVKERYGQMEAGNQELNSFHSMLNDCQFQLGEAEETLDKMDPVARDLDTLGAQSEEIDRYQLRLEDIKKKLLSADRVFRDIIDRGYLTDSEGFREQLDNLNKRWARLRDRANKRKEEIDRTTARMQDLKHTMGEVDDLLTKAETAQMTQKPIGADVDTVKQQQKEFKTYMRNFVEPLVPRLREANRVGQNLVQSAAPRVGTHLLESELEAMNDRWNRLHAQNSDREAKLNEGLLRCGKFQEALQSLLGWIGETEDLVSKQKDPSSDYKVVKAQLSEQQLLDRLITDREPSVDALKEMGEQLSRVSEPQDRMRIQQQLSDLERRWRALVDAVRDRRAKLEQTEKTAKEFHEQIAPLTEWLDATERTLSSQEPVSTDKAQIQRQIQEQQALVKDVEDHAADVKKTDDIGQRLLEMVGPVEQEVLEKRLDGVEKRYDNLREKAALKQGDLDRALASSRVFGDNEAALLKWMTETERKLSRPEPVSIHPEIVERQLASQTQLHASVQEKQPEIKKVLTDGQELLRQCTGKEIIDVQHKLDNIRDRYDGVLGKSEEQLSQLQQAVPLANDFNRTQKEFADWLGKAERDLQNFDPSASTAAQKAMQEKLQAEIDRHRPTLGELNEKGTRLIELSPGQGAAEIRQQLNDDNQRFNELASRTKDIEYQLSAALDGAQKVQESMDGLLSWLNDTERQLDNSSRETISVDPDGVRAQLKKAKAIDREIMGKQSRVQDTLGAAEKLIEQTSDPRQRARLEDQARQLRGKFDDLSGRSADRVEALEEALPHTLQFNEAHDELVSWLNDIEGELKSLKPPGLDAEEIRKEVDNNRFMKQNVAEKQQYVNKLNRIAPELAKLSPGPGAKAIKAKVDDDNQRYENVKEQVNKRGENMFDLLQRTSSFIEDLDSTLEQLNITQEKLARPEPISADPDLLRKQMKKLQALQDNIDSQMDVVDVMRKAGQDMIASSSPNDPHVRDLKDKLDQLGNKWDAITATANQRSAALQEALHAAESFWEELNGTNGTIKDLQDQIKSQEPPAVEVPAIKDQQDILHAIKEDIDAVHQDVEMTKQQGEELMRHCGDSNKPEVQKNVDELSHAWDGLNNAYRDRHDKLQDADDAARTFQDGLDRMNEYMAQAEDQLESMPAVGSDPETVRRQLEDLKTFKKDLARSNLELETVNQQGNRLLAKCTPENRELVQAPMSDMNRRWKKLQDRTFDRQHKLEAGFLALGQLDSSLDELLGWMNRTEKALADEKPITGDTKAAEIALAKHKVLQNDIMAHESSVRSVNQAGQNFMASADNRQVANVIRNKLDDVNTKWARLNQKSSDRQRELEGALGETKDFAEEATRLLRWLHDIDGQLSSAQPVGGLPETAREQLDRHNDLVKQMDREQLSYDSLMKAGQQLRQRAGPEADREGGVGQTLRTLQSQWEAARQKSDDRKRKLEEALTQAQKFHDQLQAFISWLTTAEKTMNNSKPPSTVLDTINQQIAEHKEFLMEVQAKKETMRELDRAGTQLKYFSQKQDVTLIKNLLISVQNRWDKVQSRCNDRTRQLDSGFKRAKQFDEQYNRLFDWLEESHRQLDQDRSIGSDPETLKAQLRRHKDFQRALGAKQPLYDNIVRSGRSLRDKSNPTDTKIINGQLTDLKDKWDLVCSKSVDRQRKLEEALLYSGQFKDALQALLEWLYQVEPTLSDENPVHGDIDTVINLMEAHKGFQRDLSSRKNSVKSVNKSAKDLMDKSSEDTSHLRAKLQELATKWDVVCELSVHKQERLEDAMKEAEVFHDTVKLLLDWLADAAQSLRFQGPLSDDVEVIREQIEQHKDFKENFAAQEMRLNDACAMGETILAKCHPEAVPVIKHWITVLQARWEEVMALSDQRNDHLGDALDNLQENAELLEQLMEWLTKSENTLQDRDSRPVPEDADRIQDLLNEHQSFEDAMATKQPDVDRLTKSHKRRRSTDVGQSLVPQLERSRRGRSSRPRSRDPSPGAESRNPRVAALHNKWKQVWLMAMDRRRRLQDALDRQAQLQKLRNFNFDEWRKRYLQWMNHKKARVMDFFRKLDLDRDGKLTRREFSDGIIKSKFPTNQLEMNAVADIFDRDGDGFIDYKEFIAALWPEKASGKASGKPLTDAQKIEDEVKKQISQCTCQVKFKVQRIGESKYRFGDSQQMRLVRILRSTVMVRVGGGWMALDEFLVKNDPCRAKGRTNIELREKFVLAEGVSQSMTPFMRRPRSRSPSESSTGSTRSFSTPLIKIREKRNISRPWQQDSASPSTRRTTTTRMGTNGTVTTTRETRGDGKQITRKTTTKELSPGERASTMRSPSPTGGYSTKKKVTGRNTTVSYDTRTSPAGGTRGEVTVRTVTEEERTVTMPTHRRTTYSPRSDLSSPTAASSAKNRKATSAKNSSRGFRF